MAGPLPVLQLEAAACELCQKPPFHLKAGPGCASCPAFKDTHYFPYADGPDAPDLIVLADAPQAPRLALIGGQAVQMEKLHHKSFQDDGGKVLRQAIQDVGERGYGVLKARYVYAVKCAVDSPKAAVVQSCQSYLHADLARVASTRAAVGYSGDLVVIACGLPALHALGVNVRSEAEALGRTFENVSIGTLKLTVIATRSLKSYASHVGTYQTLLADVERAARLVRNRPVQVLSRAEAAAGYRVPQTLEQVRELVDDVIKYTRPGTAPEKWAVSFDTETNTLHPQWKNLKCLGVSFAWDEGQAAFVPLWHPSTPYDGGAAWEIVKDLIRSGKPLIWHNGKYDYKVLWRLGLPMRDVGNPAWDTMLAEHVLEEDKKGEYSLKALTKRFFPQFSGYEDRLKDMLEQEDGVEEVQVSKTRKLKVPEEIARALARVQEAKLVKGTGFQSKTIENLIAKGKHKKEDISPEHLADLRIVLAAKVNGEFSVKHHDDAAREKRKKGGFEVVTLPELSFYAAVDADVTRRLAILQSRRMKDEDAQIMKWREAVRQQIANQPPEIDKVTGEKKPPRFTVQQLCADPHPSHTTVRAFKLPLMRELAKIELRGVRVDMKYLKWGTEKLDQVLAANDQQIYEICGENFKLGSGKKIASFLFEGGAGFIHPNPEHAEEIARKNPGEARYVGGRMYYRPHHFTATKQVQTSEAVLKSIVSRFECPLANLLLARRKADKARHTFFENAGKLAEMFEDEHLHGGYNQTGTATDRLSSSSGIPGLGFNYQNMPRGFLGALRDTRGKMVLGPDGKTPVFEGVKCKKLFIPDDDSMCFFNADAKGAEVTIFGSYADDDALNEALREGLDAHCFFASKALDPRLVGAGLTGAARKAALDRAGVDDDHAWSYEDFFAAHTLEDKDQILDKAYVVRLKELRTNIKRLVFGMLFGAGVKKIAEIAGIPLELAQIVRDLLFAKFPSIPLYMEQTKWELRMFGMVETYQGGRRRFPIDTSRAPRSLLARAERQGVNVKIQRTSSQIVLSTMCDISDVLERDMGGHLLLTVHDSVGGQVAKKYAHQLPDLIHELGTKKVAKNNPWLKAPYRWDVEMGSSYGTLSSAAKYLASLPAPLPEPQLDGYTEGDKIEDLRNPDDWESPSPKPDKKKAA